MKNFLKHLLCLAMAFMFLFAAACASAPPVGGNTTTSGGGNASSGSTTAAPAPSGETTSAVNRGDKTIIMRENWPTYIDPGVGSKLSDSYAFLNMYDTLTFPVSDGSLQPNLAKSWEANADSTVYTFHLRDDVKFHSGNPFTANDVKFSMDRMLTLGEGYAYLFLDIVNSVDVIDDYTVRFNLKNPSGTFPEIAIRLYVLDEKLVRENFAASGSYGEFGDYGKAWLLVNDAGSGPYKVKEMRTEEFLLMERHADYWGGWQGGEPEVIKMQGGLEVTTVRTMVSRGELDLTDYLLPPETFAELNAMDGVTVVPIPTGANYNVMLNTQLAPTDDVHVRRAMAYALDYQTLLDNVFPGARKATGPVVLGMTDAALKPEENPYNYNLEQAKAELEQSPYYDDIISGRMPIALTWCSEGGSIAEKVALTIQAGMSAIGAKVEITGKPFATMMTDAQTVETTPNASLVEYGSPYLDGGGFLKARYHSSSCGTWEQMEWLQSPEIDKMIEDAMKIADPDERNAKYLELQRMLVDLCPTIWMFDIAGSFGYRTNQISAFPAAEMAAAGKSIVYAMGYHMYFRDFRMN